MSTDLRTELQRLAGEPEPAIPPGDLWSRGVRRRRRARAVTALTTGLVLLGAVVLGTAGWDALRVLEAQPVAETSVPAIPDRLETPSPWLETTSDAGPIGPLAVIAGAQRKSAWGLATSYDSIVGVSARTGEYRFLDLPRLSSGDDAVALDPTLSPDGGAVAYLVAQPGNPDRVGGFAVYDTATGEVTERLVESELGLAPDGMAWVSPTTVLLSYGVITKRSGTGWSARVARPLLWTPSSGEVEEVVGGPTTVSEVSPTPDGYAFATASSLVVRDGADGRLLSRTRLPGKGAVQTLTPDPTGKTVLGFMRLKQNTSYSDAFKVWRLGDDPTRLDDVRTDLTMIRPALGWKDPTHVVVQAFDASRVVGAYAVDVESGEHTLLVREDRASVGAFPSYAALLWSDPTVSRPSPERVIDPRLRAAGAVALVLVGGLVVWWRRARS